MISVMYYIISIGLLKQYLFFLPRSNMMNEEEAAVEVIVYPPSLQQQPYVVKGDSDEIAEQVVSMGMGGRTFVEDILLKETRYTGRINPWDMPLWKNGYEDEEPDAYGRRKLENWRDRHQLLVNESGCNLNLPVNAYFENQQTTSGHTLLGPVVVRRVLHEKGCGDYVYHPVSPEVLRDEGLPDPRQEEAISSNS